MHHNVHRFDFQFPHQSLNVYFLLNNSFPIFSNSVFLCRMNKISQLWLMKLLWVGLQVFAIEKIPTTNKGSHHSFCWKGKFSFLVQSSLKRKPTPQKREVSKVPGRNCNFLYRVRKGNRKKGWSDLDKRREQQGFFWGLWRCAKLKGLHKRMLGTHFLSGPRVHWPMVTRRKLQHPADLPKSLLLPQVGPT